MEATKRTITVVVPALNEEPNLKGAVLNVIDSFEQLNLEGEIIIINDGSTDGTLNVANRLAEHYPNITVVSHEKPEGVGASLWDGYQRARCEFVVWTPGDGENDLSEILRYLPLMDHVDLVVPFFYNREIRGWYRNLVSKVYKAIINLTFGTVLNYMNGLVIYRRSILQDVAIKTKSFFFPTELLIKCLKRGYLHTEVPCALGQRAGGYSKALTFHSLYRVVSDYLKTALSVYVFDKGNLDHVEDSATYRRRASLPDQLKHLQDLQEVSLEKKTLEEVPTT